MNLFTLLPGILKTVGNVLGIGAITSAGDALAATQLTPEQKVALQGALAQHEEAMASIDLERFKAVMAESLAEIQSPDKYVARARPTGLYFAYAGTLAVIVATIAGVKIDSGAIITLLAPMWGQAAWYTYNRTKEKLNGGGHE
jgi:Holin of 3TMs, for gene-transfer release